MGYREEEESAVEKGRGGDGGGENYCLTHVHYSTLLTMKELVLYTCPGHSRKTPYFYYCTVYSTLCGIANYGCGFLINYLTAYG